MSGVIQAGLRLSAEGAPAAAAEVAKVKTAVADMGAAARKAGAEASGSLNAAGVSAKQLAFAMRGVPAQFTDIVTSLEAGQNPMQVFLQQGGQLKDMFGGIGPAAKALGAYVLGLVNPFTVAAAAAVALGVAYHQGDAEADAFRKQLILTGNAAGTSAGHLIDASRRIAIATGQTQGAAAEALALAVAATGVTERNLDLVAAAALNMRRATGKAIDETVSEFDKLGRAPVAASRKLDEQLHYATAEVLRQIKAFEDQGRAADAASLAQSTYAEAMNKRSAEMKENLGALEKTWRSLTGAAKAAWDAMAGIGREDSPEQKIAKAEADVKALRDRVFALNASGNDSVFADFKRQQLRDAERELAVLRENTQATEANTAAKAKADLQDEARKRWDLQNDQYLTAQARLKREVERIRNEGAAAGLPGPEIEARVAAASRAQNQAITAARLDAETTRLKAWYDEYKDVVKRALDETRIDYQDYWTLVEAGERRLAENQLRIAQSRRAAAGAAGNPAEVIKLQGEIDALRSRLSTGIAAETGRGLSDDLEKARGAGRNAQLDAANADIKALAAAAAWRRENLSLLDQELIAAREKSAADLRERLAMLAKNDALKRSPELLKEFQAATEAQSATTLAAIEAEIRDRRAANEEWLNGAKGAARDYVESVADAAGQAKRAWAGTWKRAEDDLTNFFVKGKLDVRGFVEYFISEMARINLAQPLVSKVAGASGGLFDSLGSVVGKLFGGGGSTFPPPSPESLTRFGGSAKGNVFASTDLHRYINTVVDRPTPFRFAKGGALGEFGEAGPEAIMPLKRGKDGSLGVQAQGGGGALMLTYAPVFEIDARGAAVGVGPMLQSVVDSAVDRSKSELLAELNSGGAFAYATGRRRA